MKRKSAAKFSFLMSIPIMLGAGLVTVFDLGSIEGLSSFIPVMTIGFITSALVGFLAIKWLMKYLADHPLYHFSYYLIILGIILLIFGS
jgi:undecaprenyl-diphosphatase